MVLSIVSKGMREQWMHEGATRQQKPCSHRAYLKYKAFIFIYCNTMSSVLNEEESSVAHFSALHHTFV